MTNHRAPSKAAFDASHANAGAKWPARQTEPTRLEPICKPLITPSFQLEPGESIFTIGSCFARNIEWLLRHHGFAVPCLDFEAPPNELGKGQAPPGLLNKYTPASMLNELIATAENWGPEKQVRFLAQTSDDKVLDLQLHTGAEVSMQRALERRQQVSTLYRNGVRSSRVCVITLGLTEAWFDEDSDCYLNETPPPMLTRRYPDRFSFEVLSFAHAKRCTEDIIKTLRDLRGADLRVLLTVSPVPIQRTFTDQDVIVANCHSKSVLRAVAGEIAREFAFVDYYPSFESVTHSDRALTWDDDLVHVTKDLVSHNVRNMLQVYGGQR